MTFHCSYHLSFGTTICIEFEMLFVGEQQESDEKLQAFLADSSVAARTVQSCRRTRRGKGGRGMQSKRRGWDFCSTDSTYTLATCFLALDYGHCLHNNLGRIYRVKLR